MTKQFFLDIVFFYKKTTKLKKTQTYKVFSNKVFYRINNKKTL